MICIILGLLLISVVLASPAPVQHPPTCPGCGGADCNSPCGYEWGSDMINGPLQCPTDCHCWYFTDVTGAYVPVEDPSTGKLWEGWCYQEQEPDIPEFTMIGAGLTLIGLGAFFYLRKR